MAEQSTKPKILRYAWRDAVLSEHGPKKPTTRFVLLALETFMDENAKCWPSIILLSQITLLDESTIRKHLNDADGLWISRLSKGSGSGWRRYEYQGIIPIGAGTKPARSKDGAGRQPVGAGHESKIVRVENPTNKPMNKPTRVSHLKTDQDWELYGNKVGIHARLGESYYDLKSRIRKRMEE